MTVYGTIYEKVEIDPISVIKQINIIAKDDWIKVEKIDGKLVYVQYTEESFGQHSTDMKVKEVSKEIYDLYLAKELLLKYLEKEDERVKKEQVKRDYEYYFKK